MPADGGQSNKLLCDSVVDAVCSTLPYPWDVLTTRMISVWSEATPFTEGESTRLRHGTKKIALGWITPSFVNYLSFLEVGKSPPHGITATPHPTRISRRDFNQRYHQWRQWLRLYDDVFDQTGADRLRDNATLINCFEVNIISKTERIKPGKKKKKSSSNKTTSNCNNSNSDGSLENYWRVQVALNTPDYPPDPSYWRTQITSLSEYHQIQPESVSNHPGYWRDQVMSYHPDLAWQHQSLQNISPSDPNYWRAELLKVEEKDIWKTALCEVRQVADEEETLSDDLSGSLDDSLAGNVVSTLLDENSCDSRLSSKSAGRLLTNTAILKRRRLDIGDTTAEMCNLSVGG
eukprot:TRINITY_DN11203_c1_g1_i1.p1 TRINITY_DN11203_c1_g1~~TRINITY_DN11203_c1_g1_i1.p1  ORF type:complete len:347 (+),score=58.84 TRINITY_DN11203_c1_g1_i1:51-1091(+)